MSSADDPNALAPTDATEAPARESMSLKRAREGSIDIRETPSVISIVAKKNRLDLESAAENTDDESTPAPAGQETESSSAVGTPAAGEGRTVGEVRKKVEEMTWKEGDNKAESGDAESGGAASSAASPAAADNLDAASDTSAAADSDSQSLKRKAARDQEENGSASEEKKRKSTSPPPTTETSTSPSASASAPVEPPKKPQTTFGAFSAKASPFATSSSTSAFGSTSASSPFASASQSTASPFATASKPASSGFASSGFGSYSNAFSSFASKKPLEETSAAASSASFGDILKERGETVEETKLQLDKKDVPTGEEEESTVYQTRVKLFALDDNGGWKERGVGALKLNKRRDGGSGARLVMRAEGVLRVILNSALYIGMNCLEDGKHVRTSVFEGKELKHLTIRTASPKIATELAAAISDNIPIESKRSSESPSATAKSPAAATERTGGAAEADSNAEVGGDGAEENV